MTRLTVILCLLLGMCGCADDNTARSPEGTVEVKFTLGGITAVDTPGQWQTRAATPEALADGATVRVLAYRRPGTGASLTAANYERECTYKVTNSGTTLTPCAVNSDGTVNGSGATPTAIMLLPGNHDFFAVTPALSVDHASTPFISIGHGVDYAVSLTNQSFTNPGNVPVTLSMLGRCCAQLRFRTECASGAMSSITIDRVVMTNMASTPHLFAGISPPIFDATSAEVIIPGSAFTGSGNVWAAQTVVLPKAAAAFTVKVVARFNGASNTVVNYEETVAATALEGGKSYGYILKFNGYGMKVVPDNTWDDVAMGEDEFGDSYDLNVGGKSANCYIVTGNEAGASEKGYCFDYIKPGNNSDIQGIAKPTNLGDATEARVIWQTGTEAIGSDAGVIKTVKLDISNKKVLFTAGSAVEGNAVIGIFTSSAIDAPCLWSWHIWKTATMPGESNGFLDRNIGASSSTDNVLLYQWGRKDPFVGGVSQFSHELRTVTGQQRTLEASEQTIQTTIEQPTMLIGKHPWSTETAEWPKLWGEGNTLGKAIYDPCPIGYRVPSSTELTYNTGEWLFSIKSGTAYNEMESYVNSQANRRLINNVAVYIWPYLTQEGILNGMRGGVWYSGNGGYSKYATVVDSGYWTSNSDDCARTQWIYSYWYGHLGGLQVQVQGLKDGAVAYPVRCVSE